MSDWFPAFGFTDWVFKVGAQTVAPVCSWVRSPFRVGSSQSPGSQRRWTAGAEKSGEQGRNRAGCLAQTSRSLAQAWAFPNRRQDQVPLPWVFRFTLFAFASGFPQEQVKEWQWVVPGLFAEIQRSIGSPRLGPHGPVGPRPGKVTASSAARWMSVQRGFRLASCGCLPPLTWSKPTFCPISAHLSVQN